MRPIFITGVQRSGSGIVAQIVSSCGAFVGRVDKRMENQAIRNMMNYYYQDCGWDSRGQFPLPGKVMIPTGWREHALDLLRKEGLGENGVFMLKGHRLAQIWQIWDYAFPEAQWVIVRRRTGDIIQSCLRTEFTDAFSDEEIRKEVDVETEEDGWKWWIHWHEQRFVEMITAGLDCKVVWPQRMVHGDYEQIYEMLRWLGLSWKSDVIKMVDELLCKSRWYERKLKTEKI